jgi:predicted nucleic acid-binding protein
MPERFADTSGWAAFIGRRERYHALAVALVTQVQQSGRPLLTTNLVLAELVSVLTSPMRLSRPQQIQFLKDLRSAPWVRIVPIDAALEAATWQLWESRPDKEWSLVDCASFVLMQQRGLTDALTSDHHFEQAGFVRLLK